MIVLGHRSLTLIDLDHYTRLVVRIGRENLRFLSGNSCVAGDKHGHDPASSLNTQAQWGHIQK
jgi:hypothetical protein